MKIGVYPKTHANIHNSLKLDKLQMPINWSTDTQDLLYLYNGILHSITRKLTTIDTCSNMDGPQKHHAKWKKPGKKGLHIPWLPLYKISRKRKTTETEWVAAWALEWDQRQTVNRHKETFWSGPRVLTLIVVMAAQLYKLTKTQWICSLFKRWILWCVNYNSINVF